MNREEPRILLAAYSTVTSIVVVAWMEPLVARNGHGVLAGGGTALRLSGYLTAEKRTTTDSCQERAQQEDPEQGPPSAPAGNQEKE